MQNQGERDMQRARELAESPAGKKLAALLQEKGGASVQTAIEKASSGDLQAAKEALSTVLASPEIQALLRQLGE